MRKKTLLSLVAALTLGLATTYGLLRYLQDFNTILPADGVYPVSEIIVTEPDWIIDDAGYTSVIIVNQARLTEVKLRGPQVYLQSDGAAKLIIENGQAQFSLRDGYPKTMVGRGDRVRNEIVALATISAFWWLIVSIFAFGFELLRSPRLNDY